MNKRGKDVNWSKLANASPKPKKLHLEEDDCDGLFHCPVQICKHDGFTTQRGCTRQEQTELSSGVGTELNKLTPMMSCISLRWDDVIVYFQ